MASGHVSRAERPNTRAHRPILQREKSSCQLGAVHTRGKNGTLGRRHRMSESDPNSDLYRGASGIRPSGRRAGIYPKVSSLSLSRIQLPPAGHAFKDIFPALLEFQARAKNQILHDAGHEDLAGSSLRLDAGRDVHGHADDIASAQLAFAGVEPNPDLDAKLPDPIHDGPGAFQGAKRGFEAN